MTIDVLIITGNPAFDYFFTIVFYMGLIAIVPAQIFRLFKG